MSTYQVPADSLRLETQIKRSRFITRVDHTPGKAAVRYFLNQIRQEFPDASHHCWCHIAAAPHETREWGMSDDGEPQGTAGRPMFKVLEHSGLGEITVVVSRYFGGIKLGTGGLARAYGGCVKSALEQLTTRTHRDLTTLSLTLDYDQLASVETLLKRYEAEIDARHFEIQIRLLISLPVENCSTFSEHLTERLAGRIQIETDTDASS